MKETLKKIPFIGKLLSKVYNKFNSKPNFTTSGDYWDRRYKSGGNSGSGSYNNLAEFKAQIINDFIRKREVDFVIEFGFGDGNQLKLLHAPKYLGFDISEKAVELCASTFNRDKSKEFRVLNSFNNERADLSMSLDVIYHLVEDDVFENYMKMLFQSADKYVIIYSSNTNDDKYNAQHVKHRKFSDWVEKNRSDYQLIEFIPNKYPFDGDGSKTSLADFYIYIVNHDDQLNW